MVASMPPLDTDRSRPNSRPARPATSCDVYGEGMSSPNSARESRGAIAGVGFRHLTFDSSKGLGEKTAERERFRNKLLDVGQRFVGFDKVIEDDTENRRQQEAKKFQAAEEGLVKLEKALNCEIRKRVDTNKQMYTITEQLANNMLEKLQANILVRIEKLSSSVDHLTARCASLEKGIATFRGQLPTKLQADTAALVREISELRRQMELDRKTRIERDTTMLRHLAEMETCEAGQFSKGSRELAGKVEQFKEEINVIARSQEVNDDKSEKFRSFILEEIAGMKNTLTLSAKAREQTDEEIVQAMNQYVHVLQKGLQTANNR